MRIAFIAVHASYAHGSLAYARIKKWVNTHTPSLNWKLFETTAKEDEADVAVRVSEWNPDVILSTLYLFNREQLFRILTRLHALNPIIPIAVGGPECSSQIETIWHDCPAVSTVFQGDETGVPAWIKQIQTGSYNLNEKSLLVEDENAPSVIERPSPYGDDYPLPGKSYALLQTTFGCRGACFFCTSGSGSGVSHERGRYTLSRIKSDLEVICEAGYQNIKLLDRSFNDDLEWALECLALFKNEFPEMRFHFEIHPEKISDRLLNAFDEFPAKNLHLEIGIQSLQNDVLRKSGRPPHSEKHLDALQQLTSVPELDVHSDLLGGLPGQSYDSIWQDLITLLKINNIEIQLEILKILPGTRFAEQPPIDVVWNPKPPYDVLQTDQMTAKEIRNVARLSRLVDRFCHNPQLRNAISLHVSQNSNNFRLLFEELIDTPFANPLDSPGLEKRLRTLLENSRLNDTVRDGYLFAYLLNGFNIERLNMKYYKVHDDEIIGELVWRAGTSRRLTRFADWSAACDIHSILTADNMDSLQLKKQLHRYRFFYAGGNQVMEVRKIID